MYKRLQHRHHTVLVAPQYPHYVLAGEPAQWEQDKFQLCLHYILTCEPDSGRMASTSHAKAAAGINAGADRRLGSTVTTKLYPSSVTSNIQPLCS